jgi:tRNA threonylcarbamoyladenosine biosynthesis protein TsaB
MWSEETYSARMFRHLDFLLRELSLDLKQFDLFAVAAGPGSFTGLGVGLTAIKGWAEVYTKPAVGVSGLEAIAAQSHSEAPLLIPILDARRGQIYFGFYRRGGNGLALEGEECVMTPDEFLEMLRSRVADTDFTIVTPEPEIISRQVSQIEKRTLIGRLGYQRAQRGQVSDALLLDANYVRRTDAELHWKVP